MARYRLSHRAEDDFLNILNYTVRKWGPAQAALYLDRIESSCEALAQIPTLGRSCEWIAPNLHRMEEGKHVIFYRYDSEEVKIVRVLHQNMLPLPHMMEDSRRTDTH